MAMKIPDEIRKKLDERERLGIELQAVCSEVDNWLIENGANMNELKDSVLTGCFIYVEPWLAKKLVSLYIEERM